MTYRKIVLIATIVCFGLCRIFANSIDLSFYQNDKSVNFNTVLKVDNAKILYSLTQDKNGYFVLNAPYSFSIDIRDTLKFGELKPNGIVYQMLKPSDLTTSIQGFNEKRFSNVSTPAINPKYRGIEIPFPGFEIFALKTNSYGFGFDANSGNFFFSALVNDYRKTGYDIEDFQVDWQSYAGTSQSIMFLLGANSSARIKGYSLRSQVFIRGLKDINSQPEFSTGFDISLSYRKTGLILRNRLGSFGQINYLKIENPNFEYNVKDNVSKMPIYNGLYQPRDLSIQAKLKISRFEIANSIAYTRTKKGNETRKNELEISYQQKDRKLKAKTDFESLSFTYTDKKAKVTFGSLKTEIEFTYAFELNENFWGKLIINNERQLSAALHFKD